LRSERDPQLRPRLHLLVLLKSGQVTTRRQAATHLAVHRNTVALWLRTYRDGGLTALLTYKEPGAPSSQKSLPAAVFEQLQARLATSSGFASYIEIQQWLREAFGLEVPYKTLHGIVRYQLKATLKRPRPRHAKKTPPRRLTLSNSVPAAWAPLRP
jgi:transposase